MMDEAKAYRVFVESRANPAISVGYYGLAGILAP
jgi:hypothetical protein